MEHHLQHLADLVALNRLKGIVDAVVSPGSRNAPLIRLLSEDAGFNLVSIVDERSAGYFALGMALALQKPVLLVCTSGTAVLNYGPALAEAFYQHVPLIAITADRPEELIGQQDNQTINQIRVFQNYTKGFLQVQRPGCAGYEAASQHRQIDWLLNQAVTGIAGPVHLNVPIEEPLYVGVPVPATVKVTSAFKPSRLSLGEEVKQNWAGASKRLIVCGQEPLNEQLTAILNHLASTKQAVVLAEPIANIRGENIFNPVDRLLMAVSELETDSLKPDLLISLGGPVVSKRLNSWLRKQHDLCHYRLTPENDQIDTYQNLTSALIGNPGEYLSDFADLTCISCPDYYSDWNEIRRKSNLIMDERLPKLPFSDLTVMGVISSALPKDCILHLGNSSPVRYALLFELGFCHQVLSNRGVSGIDGCLSTAVGFASCSEKLNVLILGDLSFLYDSNGLWNRNLPQNLRIIVINNQGGGIFRLLQGPTKQSGFESYIEAFHKVDIGQLTAAFGLSYMKASCIDELESCLDRLFQHDRGITLLEVRTLREDNAPIYSGFVEQLKLK